MAIETGSDKNAIARVKHHKAGAARADNGPVVYKKVGKIAKTCLLLVLVELSWTRQYLNITQCAVLK